MNNNTIKDKIDIDNLINSFFGLFCVDSGCNANLNGIYNIFIPNASIIKNVGSSLEIYNLKQFIEPRQKMFDDGFLREFKEKELCEKTDIFGNIAQRICVYEKCGFYGDTYIKCKGMKVFQFIKIKTEWKISSSAWDDERENLSICDSFFSTNTID